MNYLSQAKPEEFSGKHVIVRLDLNVPLGEDGHVDEFDADRIKSSMKTIDFLKDAGAKIIIISHIGRDPHETLRPVAEYMHIPFFTTYDVKDLETNQVIMLENLRSNPGEELNDEVFAQQLASYGEIYVNDAFAVSHRAHASLVGVPKLLPSFAGFQLQSEIENLSQSFSAPHPSILILGGAKFETKLPVIQKFSNIVDHIIIGGALANDFYRAMGYEIGASLIDDTASVKSLLENTKIIIPKIVIVENEQGTSMKSANAVSVGDKIVDIAPEALDEYKTLFNEAQFILWNGPLGNYENGFVHGSEKVAKMISETSAKSIVGGGDSVALVEQLGIADKFGFISTGGGAMLEYLENGTLPGIDALG